MDYRIEEKDAFRIVGVREHMELDIEANFARTPQFWAETFENGMFEVVCALGNKEPQSILGVSTCMNGKDFDYYIASATDKPTPDGTHAYTVPAGTWAVFPCTGPMPDAIQALQKRIVTEWLPVSGYEYANAPDIEVYPAGDTASPDYKCEVWLPIVKK